jgi:4'-phosphopantetheinyl transferase EntD
MDRGISVVVNEKQVAGQRSAWQSVLPVELQNAHANRRGEWLTSRAALQIAFAKAGVTLEPLHVRFSGYQQIVGLEDWRFSISHTDDWAFVWLMHRDGATGIGADLENEKRKVSASAANRIVNPADIKVKPLALWGIKEAAFKSLPIDAQESIQIPDIVVEESSFHIRKAGLSGNWHQEEVDHFIRSYAWRI